MYYKRHLILFSWLLLAGPAVHADDEPPVVTVLAEEFWPYSYTTDTSGEPEGILIEFAKELIATAGLQHDIQLLPWPRVMKRVRERENQLILTLIRTPEREDRVHWIGAVAEVNHALYGLDSDTPPPATLEELQSKVVATVVDDIASDYLKDKGFSNLVRTSDHLRGLEMLTRGRVDLYPGNIALIDFQCRELAAGCANIRLEYALTDLEQELFFAMSPSTDEAVVETLRQQFVRLVDDGRLEAIRTSFLEVEESTAIE